MKIAYVLAIGASLLVLLYWVVDNSTNVYQADTGPISAPIGVYDPVRAGEATPSGFRQVLPRDAIRPVYNPTFTSAGESEWEEETLVIGLSVGEESKAYPVSFLNRREMVIDWIGGTPVLVSW